MAAILKPRELLINIQFDKICVKPELHFTADSIVGNAELLTCTECGTYIIIALGCFANILLKYYSTTESETVSRSKNSRKVSKF